MTKNRLSVNDSRRRKTMAIMNIIYWKIKSSFFQTFIICIYIWLSNIILFWYYRNSYIITVLFYILSFIMLFSFLITTVTDMVSFVKKGEAKMLFNL
jgi:hypothetical protein